MNQFGQRTLLTYPLALLPRTLGGTDRALRAGISDSRKAALQARVRAVAAFVKEPATARIGKLDEIQLVLVGTHAVQVPAELVEVAAR